MDALTRRRALQSVLDSPKLIDQAAARCYEEDGRDCMEDRAVWDDLGDEFKDVFRSGVRQSIRCVLEAMPFAPAAAPRVALPWESDARQAA